MSLSVNPVLDQREYVGGGGRDSSLFNMRRVLPEYVDDLTRDFGTDLYTRMARDPVISSCIRALKLSVLSEGVRVVPAVEMPAFGGVDPAVERDAEIAAELAAFVERNLDLLADSGSSFDEACDALLDMIVLGHKVAEKVPVRVVGGEDSGRWMIGAIKPKPSSNLGFVVDPYNNLLGLVVVDPEKDGSGVSRGPVVGRPEDFGTFLPRERFVVARNGGVDGDPRGESVLSTIYNPWYLKSKILPEFYKYLAQFGTPCLVGKTPVGAGDEIQRDKRGQPIYDNSGEPVLTTPEQRMYDAMLQFQGSSIFVAPGGSEIDLVASNGDGKAFLDAIDLFDRQITRGILLSVRAVMESQHGSKADSQVAQDIMGLAVSALRQRLAAILSRDVIQWLVRVNFGDAALRLAPRFTFARVEQQDRSDLLKAYAAAYAAGLIDDSQLRGIDAELGLPERDLEAMAARREESSMLARLAAGQTGKLIDPEADDDD